jgi:hypothetical protein
LDDAIAQLEQLPHPFVDRATLESVLGVGRRRAQQILQPFVHQIVGRNGLARKEDIISHLRHLARGDAAHFERRRRERLHAILDNLQRQAKEQPQVLVEAPTAVLNQELERLPAGVHLSPGRIQIDEFRTSDEAKQKLLALILAIGNDPDGFDDRITVLD